MSSWIKIDRAITSHWIYTEKRRFSKFEAWNDILLMANYKPCKTYIKGKLIDVDRGECVFSLETWAKRWGWNKSAVKRFLELLQNDSMIRYKNETVTIRLTVCNYALYQDRRNDNETQTKRRRNADETQTKPIEEYKESKEGKNIEERKRDFISSLEPFVEVYGRDMLNNFFRYWAEPNKKKTKMKYELQETWDLAMRLSTWHSRSDEFDSKPKKQVSGDRYK